MWVVTNKGFMSVVAKDAAGKPSGKSPDSIVSVRFRRPSDAKALFPKHPLVMTPKGDYACRVFATRLEVGLMLAAQVSGLDYQNFKDSIPKTAEGNKLHGVAHRAWSVFGDLQDGGPYGRWTQPVAQPLLPYDDDFDPALGRWTTAVAVAKGKRVDPFCDGCGERVGAKHINRHGLCKVCRTIPEMVRVWGGKQEDDFVERGAPDY